MTTPKYILILSCIITGVHFSSHTLAQVQNNVPNVQQQTQMLGLVKKMHQRYIDFDDPEQFRNLQITSADRFTDGEELIFTLSVEDILLTELIGIKHEEGARFLITDFIEALDFPIEFADGVYSGWFIAEDNLFELRLPTDSSPLQLVIDNEVLVIEPEKYISLDDGIYINADELSRWFGINVRFDFTDQNVRLYPSTPLPIQQKIARRNQTIRDSMRNVKPVLPRRSNDYQALSPQTIDANIGVRVTENNETANYSLIGARDFAFLRSEFYLSGNQDNLLNDGRLKFSKTSTQRDLLGIGATQFEFGDITPIRTSGQTSNLSPGFSVTNSPVGQLNDLNVTNFTGPVQEGWDVELYRNNILLNAQYNIENGLYDFRDVPLVFGLNAFEIVFYGPQGQIERKVIERTVDRTLQNNRGVYAFSITKMADTLLNIRSDQNLSVDRGYLFSGSYRQNLADNVSLTATTANQFAGDDDINRFALSLNARVFDQYLLGLEGIIDDQNSNTLNANFRTQFGKQNITGNVRFNEFLDEDENKVTSNLFRLTMTGNIEPFKNVRLSYLNEIELASDFNGLESTEFRNSIGTTIWGTRVNTGLTVIDSENLVSNAFNEDTITKLSQTNFNLGLQRSIGRTFARFQSNFNLDNSFDAESMSLQLSRSFPNNINTRLTLSHSLISDNDSADLNVRWRKDGFALDSSLGYSEQTGASASVNLRFGVGYNPMNEHYFFKNSGLANSGTLVVNVFQDTNMNGTFDEGETPISGAQIRAVQAFKSGVSDAQGMAIINNLTDNAPTDIVLDIDTLPDPFLMPLTKGFSITPRGGFIDTADIPVVFASEVEGSLFVVDKFGSENTVSNVVVHLLDEDGNKYATTVSEYDGYYLFTDVLPGNYTVSIENEYIEINKLKDIPDINITLNQSGELSSGNDFILYYQAINLRYVVTLGEFTSRDVLDAFWSVMLSKYPTILGNIRPYIFRSENDRNDLLSIYFSQDKSKANRQCDLLFQYGIDCEVIAHRTYID